MTAAGLLVATAIGLAVKTGLSPGADPLVSCPIDPLAGPVHVVDAAGRETASAVRTDPSGGRHVAFRAVGAQVLEVLDYRVVEGRGTLAELPGVPRVLPGMNLFENADFSARDAAGDLLGWRPAGPSGAKAAWDEKTRSRVRVKGGVLGVENVGLLTYVTGLEAGHVYRLSFDACSAAKMLLVTLWFRGTRGTVANDWVKGVSNYKNDVDLRGTNAWQHIEKSTFVYYDPRAKRQVRGNRELLPGTGSAFLEVVAVEGRGAVRNLRLEDVTSDTGVRAVRRPAAP